MERFRVVALVALCVLGLGACRDSGLPGKNLPLQEARMKEFRYPAYQATADQTPVGVAGRHYIGSLPIENIPDRLMVQIADAEGGMFYTMRGRTAPYSRLYARVGPDRWRPYTRLN